MINIATFITNITITIVIVTTIAHHHSDQAAHLERLDLSYNIFIPMNITITIVIIATIITIVMNTNISILIRRGTWKGWT